MKRSRPDMREVYIVLPPDRGFSAWLIVFASFMVNFVIDGIIYSFGSMVHRLSEDLHTSMSNMSIVGSTQIGLLYLCGPLTCAFVNRFGFRIVVFSGAAITCIGILIASFLTSFLGIAKCFGFLGGLGFGIMFPPSIIIIGYYFEKYRAVAVGIALVGASAGVLCLTPLFNHITSKYGWQTTMQAQALSLSICMLSSLAYRSLEPTKVLLSQEYTRSARPSMDSKVEFIQIYDNVDTAAKNHKNEYKMKSMLSEGILPLKSPNALKRKAEKCCDFFLGIFSCKYFSSEQKSDATITTGPLDRKDIFYSGSLMLLPEYRADKRKQSVGTSLSYHLSMIHVGSIDDESRAESCCNCSNMFMSVLKRLFDISILKSLPFCTFSLCNFFYIFALYIPYLFIRKKADMNNISVEYSNWFISAIAVGNGIGRASSGAICSFIPKINKCYLVGLPTIFAGIITIISSFVLEDNEYYQLFFCFVMGFSIAFNAALRAVVIVYLLGLEKLTNAFGLIMMFMGFSALLGVPIATMISESTGTYTYVFLLAGICFSISGGFVILAFHTHEWNKKKTEKQ